ncbi:MAG TPA: BTAD domain-containing putative transcriptional regulator, partial [Anaerolineales bacterium]
MSERLALYFLGLPQIHLDQEPITLERRKALALLAYLALEPGEHSRDSLSALLWPDISQSKAFKNLRQVLWEVQKTIGERWLVGEHGNVELIETQVWLDVREFLSLYNAGCAQSDISLRIPLLADAAKLYRNHFLAGFSLKDAYPFNDWAFAESEDMRHKLSIVLSKLSEDYCTIGNAGEAIAYARRLVSLDPLNEMAHRQLMEVYLQTGQQNAALKQYRELEQSLRKELNLDPQPGTRELYKKIRKGEWKPAPKSERSNSVVLQESVATSLPTGTVTFLFTDIEDSTKLAAQYPDSMPSLLTRQHEILNQALQAHRGYVFQVVGDSVAAAFHSTSDALEAALAAQRLLQKETWSPAPIKVRMAIHTGTAQVETASKAMKYSNYATLAMTQRIMTTGHGGQVLLSQVAHELAREALPEGADLRDLGEYYLKDFGQTERIYQMVIPGLTNEFPPLRISDGHPNNLPVQLSTFIGRGKEQAEITSLIAENRLVTLVGVGGIGKTRLSLQSARAGLNIFPSGVWFIELASLSDPARVPQTVFRALGLIEQAGRSQLDIITEFLRSKRALLILDNCEHLIHACAQFVQDILYSCPDLHILATSREALDVPGETLYVVPTLTTPDPLHITLETISAYESTQLFVERAQSALAGFKPTNENLPAIARLCRDLDGIPL